MKSLRLIFAAFAAACLTSLAVFAGDPSGTWKWSVPGRDGQTRESILKLELKDGKLAGSLSGFRGETPISDAKFADDQVAFKVVRETPNGTFEMKYSGKLAGDTITGNIEGTGRDGQPFKRDWTATRAK